MLKASVWVSLALTAYSHTAYAQDDGPIGQVGQGIAFGDTLTVEEQRALGLVTVNAGCSGTLINRYWVLTADHCVTTTNTIGGPLSAPSSVGVTATWSPQRPVATRLVSYAANGLDMALIYLGEGDFGPVDVQPLFVGPVEPGLNLRKYGQGFGSFAKLNPPTAATGSGVYRTAFFTASWADALAYTLPTNSEQQVGHGGDSGGPDVVEYNGIPLGIAGVQSTCVPSGMVPGMSGWAWATGVESCNSAAIETVRWEIQQEIQDTPDGAVWVGRSNGAAFGAGERWIDGFCTRNESCAVGDVNGDGLDDAIRFVKSDGSAKDSDVWVALSDGTRFLPPQKWQDYFCTLNETCAVADVNGDGFDDVVTFVKTNHGANDSDVYVALSDGSRFGPGQRWADYFCTLDQTCAVGDVNGDGMADLITFVKTNHGANDSDVNVALSTGSGFGAGQKWHERFCTLDQTCRVGDVNGDGRTDLLLFVKTDHGSSDSDVWVSLSTGSGFGANQKWHDYMCTLDETCAVGDVTGDGRSDAVAFVRTNNGVGDSDVWIAPSTGTTFGGGQKWHDFFCTLDETCALGDVDGDGRDDAIAFVRGD
jgi:hypothetical protein